LPKTGKGEPNLKTGEASVDSDELQLIDEYNERWVYAWKQAVAHPDARTMSFTKNCNQK
jgi:hypothetical protein